MSPFHPSPRRFPNKTPVTRTRQTAHGEASHAPLVSLGCPAKQGRHKDQLRPRATHGAVRLIDDVQTPDSIRVQWSGFGQGKTRTLDRIIQCVSNHFFFRTSQLETPHLQPAHRQKISTHTSSRLELPHPTRSKSGRSSGRNATARVASVRSAARRREGPSASTATPVVRSRLIEGRAVGRGAGFFWPLRFRYSGMPLGAQRRVRNDLAPKSTSSDVICPHFSSLSDPETRKKQSLVPSNGRLKRTIRCVCASPFCSVGVVPEGSVWGGSPMAVPWSVWVINHPHIPPYSCESYGTRRPWDVFPTRVHEQNRRPSWEVKVTRVSERGSECHDPQP